MSNDVHQFGVGCDTRTTTNASRFLPHQWRHSTACSSRLHQQHRRRTAARNKLSTPNVAAVAPPTIGPYFLALAEPFALIDLPAVSISSFSMSAIFDPPHIRLQALSLNPDDLIVCLIAAPERRLSR
jgi:hypothetical protein